MTEIIEAVKLARTSLKEKGSYLDNLYKNFGDFYIAIGKQYQNTDDWSKWYRYSELIKFQPTDYIKKYSSPDSNTTIEAREFLRLSNYRSVFDTEIVFDVETKEESVLKDVEEKLKIFSYTKYYTGGKGYHYHSIFSELKNYNKESREKIKENAIKWIGSDLTKKSDKNLIGLEGEPHRKTGVLKLCLGINLIGINKLNPEWIVNMTPEEKHSDFDVEEILSGVTQGSRDNTAFRLACHYKGKGLLKEETKLFLDKWNEQNNPPLSKTDLGKCLNSAYSYKDTSNKKPSKELKESVFQALKEENQAEATELVSTAFLEINSVYTIRDDKITESWIYSKGIYVPEGQTYIKEFCREILGKCYTSTFANRVLAKIEADTYIDKDTFFNLPSTNINEIPVLNGILNIKTRTITEFTPAKVFFNKIPVVFDPTQKIKKIDQFFKDILLEEDIPIIQELFGYCLLMDYPIAKAFMFSGHGSNGKSRLTALFKLFVGAENCSNVSLNDIQENQYATAEFHNKMLNIAGDIGAKAINDTEKFKQLTGRDRIGANRKYLKMLYFLSYAKWINACNELPKPRDLSDGFFRRWIIIKFVYRFVPKKEYDLLENKNNVKIANDNIIEEISTQEELSGLLNFALDGLDRLLKKGCFSYSKTTEDVNKEWLKSCNSFQAFFEDCLKESYDSELSKNELREKYANYCSKNKVRPESDFVIKDTLTKHGVWEKRIIETDEISNRKTRDYVWCGLKFKQEVQNELC